MAVRILLLAFILTIQVAVRAQEPAESPKDSILKPGQAYIERSVEGGFRENPEFDRVDELEKQGKTKEALSLLTEIIGRDAKLFPSSRRERFLKGVAFFKRGIIRSKNDSSASPLDDFQESAKTGFREANYHAAAHLLIRIKYGQSDNATKDRDAAFRHYLAGAELGSSVCIDHIQIPLNAQGDSSRAHYWFLLERMGEEPEKVLQFAKFYFDEYTADDRKFLRNVMSELSLCGGESESKIDGLPGRSLLTSAYVDLYMRKQLNFVWHAFFDRDAPDAPLREVYDGSRLILREDSPIVDLWMIVNREYAAADVEFQASAAELAQILLPGDQIVVRCGRLSHVATVWDIDRSGGTVRVLDPFPQYWLPEQNRCVTVMDQVQYKHQRELTLLSLSELQKMLVAVLTVRDLRAASVKNDE